MKNKKVIMIAIFLVAFMAFTGCTKRDKTNITTDHDISIVKLNVMSDVQPHLEFEIKPNVIFYVLIDEYLENNDVNNPNASEFKRVYICYDGVENAITPHSITVFLEKVSSVIECRNALFLNYPSNLKLLPNTIVSEKVLKIWESQGYDGLGSYSDESPNGLSYPKIK